MKFKAYYIPLLFLLFALPLEAAIVVKDGKLLDAEKVATMSVQDHFSLGINAKNKRDWIEAATQFTIVVNNFPLTSYGIESHYHLGEALFYMQDFDYANEELSEYLKKQSNPKFFLQAIQYKYGIAEQLKNGARKRVFDYSFMPKWASGKGLALKIYDEVIAAMPCHDLAARSLYSKAELHWSIEEYKESVECYQSLIRRFPKHQGAPESYLLITEVYLEQCQVEFQNPDLITLAEINVRRFTQDFPRDERLQEAENNVALIKEVYAQGLYDTGQFYERVKKPHASILYYRNAIQQFPETQVADLCKKRLEMLEQG